MPKSLKSLSDHVSNIVESRERTLNDKFKPLPSGVEHINDVLYHAICFLGDHLQPHGFKVAPSKLSLSRKLGETIQAIRLRTGEGNLSGVNVQISAEALIKSSSLKRWTQTKGTRHARELIWIRQLGYPAGNKQHIKWQLADKNTRNQELVDLLEKIKNLALPAFEAWADRTKIGKAVFRGTEVDRIDWLVETALWSDNIPAAISLIHNYLENHPNDAQKYATELARFQEDQSIDEPRHDPVSGIAFLVARHSLEINVSL